MKHIKKLTATLLAAFILMLPLAVTSFAADFFTKDNLSAVAQMFGIDLSDPQSIQNAINEIQNGGLSGLVGILGIDINGILNELKEYLFAFESETTTEEPTTEEPTTEEPTTEAPTAPPTTAPSYQYTPSVTTPTVTQPVETTTFQYIPPEQVYTEAYTTTVFQPVIEDNGSDFGSDVSPFKTALGIILLLGSGIGVIVVVLALKRNRI